MFVAVAPWSATAAHAAVTSATFSGSTLTVVADGGDDDISLRHDGLGTIELLDHGAPVAIAGGPATLTNTDTISIDAGGGTDRVTHLRRRRSSTVVRGTTPSPASRATTRSREAAGSTRSTAASTTTTSSAVRRGTRSREGTGPTS